MSKLISKSANNLRFTNARNSGNLVAVFDVDGVQHRSTTRVKSLPSSFDNEIFVATSEDGNLIVNEFPTQNGTIYKMVPFVGWNNITQRDLVDCAAEKKFTGSLNFSM